MPDEIGTEATRSDAPGADDSLSGDAADKTDDAPAVDAGEQDSNLKAEQDLESSEDAGDKPDAEAQADAVEELKVVLSIKGGRATIGVQRPSADPHIESFDDHDLSGLAQEVPAVTERARTRWEDAPKHPSHARPVPPPRRRNRPRQGATQASTAEGETEREQGQTPRLF